MLEKIYPCTIIVSILKYICFEYTFCSLFITEEDNSYSESSVNCNCRKKSKRNNFVFLSSDNDIANSNYALNQTLSHLWS